LPPTLKITAVVEIIMNLFKKSYDLHTLNSQRCNCHHSLLILFVQRNWSWSRLKPHLALSIHLFISRWAKTLGIHF